MPLRTVSALMTFSAPASMPARKAWQMQVPEFRGRDRGLFVITASLDRAIAGIVLEADREAARAEALDAGLGEAA